jgi:AcrR family transcriptional regulator
LRIIRKENVSFSFAVAQRPKEHVREGIVSAAAALFAEVGYERATMADVAERANSSIGNVYRYFGGKKELLDAVVPEGFARDIRRLTRARIEALGDARDIAALAPDARYHVLAGELLDYCIAHRERVVILLARAAGTRFASFAARFQRQLVRLALAYAHRAGPAVRPTPALRFALGRIYEGYLASVAEAFALFQTEAQIREAVSHLTAHHQGGLRRLFETAAKGEIAR